MDSHVLTDSLAAVVRSVDESPGSSMISLTLALGLGADRLIDVVPAAHSSVSCAADLDEGIVAGWSTGRHSHLSVHTRLDDGPLHPPVTPPNKKTVLHQGSLPLGRWEATARRKATTVLVASASLRGIERSLDCSGHDNTNKVVTVLVTRNRKPPREVRKALRRNDSMTWVSIPTVDSRDLTQRHMQRMTKTLTNLVGDNNA